MQQQHHNNFNTSVKNNKIKYYEIATSEKKKPKPLNVLIKEMVLSSNKKVDKVQAVEEQKKNERNDCLETTIP